MVRLFVSDKVEFIKNRTKLKALQKQYNLEEIDYDKLHGLFGFVDGIKGNTIRVNFVIKGNQYQINVCREGLILIPQDKSISLKVGTKDLFPVIPLVDPFKSLNSIEFEKISKAIVESDNVEALNNCNINTTRTVNHHICVKDVGMDPGEGCAMGFNRTTCNKGPFLVACQLGSVDIAILLLDKDPSVINHVDVYGNSAIHYLLQKDLNDAKVLLLLNKILLCKELDLSIADKDGYTAFHRICCKGDKSVAFKIIDICNENKRSDILRQLTNDKECAAQLAIESGHCNLAAEIIGKVPMKWSDFDFSKKHGSILESAIKCTCLPLVLLIISKDKDIVNKVNSRGQSPLDVALTLCQTESYVDQVLGNSIVQYLKDKGAQIGGKL